MAVVVFQNSNTGKFIQPIHFTEELTGQFSACHNRAEMCVVEMSSDDALKLKTWHDAQKANRAELYEQTNFTPINGLITVQQLTSGGQQHRVIAIAKNAVESGRLKDITVGTLVILRSAYMGNGTPIDTIRYINVADIAAVLPEKF